MPLDLDWNDDEIMAGAEEAFQQANEVLGREFVKEITSTKWAWPNPPSPRDIVDDNDLRNSYKGERTRAGRDPAHDHSWNIEYAMAVHNGAVFKADSVPGKIWTGLTGMPTMPARPWTLRPLRDGTLERAYERLMRQRMGRIQ